MALLNMIKPQDGKFITAYWQKTKEDIDNASLIFADGEKKLIKCSYNTQIDLATIGDFGVVSNAKVIETVINTFIVSSTSPMLVPLCKNAPNPFVSIIANAIPNIWNIVFILPDFTAAIATPLSEPNILKDDAKKSLHIITATIHAGTVPKPESIINPDATNNLSANGSIIFPKLVTKLFFLDILPSRASVTAAITNIAKAI